MALEKKILHKNKKNLKIMSYYQIQKQFKLDFCLTVHHQLGKVIQMNQLDADLIDQYIIVASSWFICITLPQKQYFHLAIGFIHVF